MRRQGGVIPCLYIVQHIATTESARQVCRGQRHAAAVHDRVQVTTDTPCVLESVAVFAGAGQTLVRVRAFDESEKKGDSGGDVDAMWSDEQRFVNLHASHSVDCLSAGAAGDDSKSTNLALRGLSPTATTTCSMTLCPNPSLWLVEFFRPVDGMTILRGGIGVLSAQGSGSQCFVGRQEFCKSGWR